MLKGILSVQLSHMSKDNWWYRLGIMNSLPRRCEVFCHSSGAEHVTFKRKLSFFVFFLFLKTLAEAHQLL